MDVLERVDVYDESLIGLRRLHRVLVQKLSVAVQKLVCRVVDRVSELDSIALFIEWRRWSTEY